MPLQDIFILARFVLRLPWPWPMSCRQHNQLLSGVLLRVCNMPSWLTSWVLSTVSYYGETAFLFAVCTNQPSVVDFLLRCGANATECDSEGNNALHLCVLHGLSLMHDHICTHVASHAVEKMCAEKNNRGLNPLCLAANIGHKRMFSFLLSRMKTVHWNYGPVTSVLYPLRVRRTKQHRIMISSPGACRPLVVVLFQPLVPRFSATSCVAVPQSSSSPVPFRPCLAGRSRPPSSSFPP